MKWNLFLYKFQSILTSINFYNYGCNVELEQMIFEKFNSTSISIQFITNLYWNEYFSYRFILESSSTTNDDNKLVTWLDVAPRVICTDLRCFPHFQSQTVESVVIINVNDNVIPVVVFWIKLNVYIYSFLCHSETFYFPNML